jgi:electron transfer flavoprotein alpha subunit
LIIEVVIDMSNGNEDFSGVLVFSENETIVQELLSKGRELADKLNTPLQAVMLHTSDEGFAKDLIAFGADKVYKVSLAIETLDTEQYSNALINLITELKPQIVLLGSNRIGKELAPRLAGKFNSGSAAECIAADLDENNNLKIQRVVFSGNGVATQTFATKPQIVTLALQTFKPLPKDEGRTGEIIVKTVAPKETNLKVVNVSERTLGGVCIEDADFIVSIGRGLKNKEDLPIIKGLAESLKGEIGCSRPIASDLKWLPTEHWVGLSGHKVKPRIYIACGISGQIQHLAGMRDSDIIVAINKDPEAPIFNAADYGIVGDIYKVVPAIVDKLKSQ